MEQLLGPDIAANPVWNTRPKTPSHAETHVGWHQGITLSRADVAF